MDSARNDDLRSELEALTPDGDLVRLADDLRRMGGDSLLVCRPGGQIRHVVSEHRIRRLAQPVPAGLPYIPDQPAPSETSGKLAEGERIGAQPG